MTDAPVLFRETLQSIYGPLDWLPEPDGDIHRFHVPGDKSGSVNGWYVLYLDGIASGAFGSWKTGGAMSWCSREPLDTREAEQIRQRIDQARRQREAGQQRRQQAAAKYAQRLWGTSRPADPEHPYLSKKRVHANNLRQIDDVLLVPMYADGALVNIQRISADGEKRFLFGGQVTGAYYVLGDVSRSQKVYIAEGLATALTLHKLSGSPVVAAMNSGNLAPVALALKAKYSAHEIIIAGDDDRMTEGNPGRRFAVGAAIKAMVKVCFPIWPEEAPPELTDFNDLVNWRADHEACQ
ncbi:toprim domain-containing protein [Pseudomonas sp. CCC3.2]|uniref:toprim domain-containing protein n=1 Tax=unclassified Pseudomonas TaxID=196821 RepID=UPI002AB4E588|nr:MULTISPECIES: toprim domain-containing protein [unclassified Pseudomonas]MDY7558981.1 toprim domain-containing protein [Pseudomonas sp. AB6]MEB0180169.1 toprim domain-containing protein [Pseudomonas sp. CCC3.2]MEB0209049.1 toprim domain-containing protein [Pseudomonas sp. AB6]